MTSVQKIERAIIELDPNLKRTDTTFMDAMIVLAAVSQGANETDLAKFLSFDPEFVALVGSRLRGSGVWLKEETSKEHFEAWQHPQTGGIAFWLDVAVGAGEMICSGRDQDGTRYEMTDSGRRKVEAIISQSDEPEPPPSDYNVKP